MRGRKTRSGGLVDPEKGFPSGSRDYLLLGNDEDEENSLAACYHEDGEEEEAQPEDENNNNALYGVPSEASNSGTVEERQSAAEQQSSVGMSTGDLADSKSDAMNQQCPELDHPDSMGLFGPRSPQRQGPDSRAAADHRRKGDRRELVGRTRGGGPPAPQNRSGDDDDGRGELWRTVEVIAATASEHLKERLAKWLYVVGTWRLVLPATIMPLVGAYSLESWSLGILVGGGLCLPVWRCLAGGNVEEKYDTYMAYDKGVPDALVCWEIEMKDDHSVGVVTGVVKGTTKHNVAFFSSRSGAIGQKRHYMYQRHVVLQRGASARNYKLLTKMSMATNGRGLPCPNPPVPSERTGITGPCPGPCPRPSRAPGDEGCGSSEGSREARVLSAVPRAVERQGPGGSRTAEEEEEPFLEINGINLKLGEAVMQYINEVGDAPRRVPSFSQRPSRTSHA